MSAIKVILSNLKSDFAIYLENTPELSKEITKILNDLYQNPKKLSEV